MRVFLFVFLMLFPLTATAAPGDSVETRLRLLEQKLESQKDDAKTEAGRVENRFLDRIGSLELTVSQQNSHVDQVLSQLNLSIAIGGIIIAVVALLGAWKAILVAKAEARDVLRETKEEITQAKADVVKARAEVEALLKEVQQGHGEAMTAVAELKAANISPAHYTPDQQATITAAAERAAAKSESERTEIDRWALAQQAVLAGKSDEAEAHLAEADEGSPWTWVLRSRLKLTQGERPEAQQAAETALRLAQEQGMKVLEGLALEALESVLRADGKLPEAKAVGETALELKRQLIEEGAADLNKQKNLAVSLRRLASICLEIKDLDSAAKYIDEVMSVSRSLVASDNNNQEYRRDLALSCERLGELYFRKGCWSEAKLAFDESMGLRKALLAENPKNTRWLYEMTVCWTKLCGVAMAENDWPQARACAVEYRILSERLATIDCNNVVWQANVAYARRDNADCDSQLGHLGVAKAGYQAAVEILEALDRDGKLSAQVRRLLAECQGKLARLKEDARGDRELPGEL